MGHGLRLAPAASLIGGWRQSSGEVDELDPPESGLSRVLLGFQKRGTVWVATDLLRAFP